jgi:hypothetical protein
MLRTDLITFQTCTNKSVKQAHANTAFSCGFSINLLGLTFSSYNFALNPYRCTAKCFDTGSGTLDMGAHRFAAGVSRFLQSDLYRGAQRPHHRLRFAGPEPLHSSPKPYFPRF